MATETISEYELTQEQLDQLLGASRPVPYLIFNGVAPISPQESSNRVWQALGREMDFDWTTVEPIPGRDQRSFRACPLSAAGKQS